jgi:hypothetical protein
LRKWRNNAKKMELENANLKEAHMTIAEKWESKMQVGKSQNCKWKKNRKSKCNLERGTFDK